MGKIIPFFHYDLLARIIPGAATLAAVFILGGSCVSRPLGFFSPDQWKTLGVPIVLGGLCYLVGVVYETLDYILPCGWPTRWLEDWAFTSVWNEWVTEEKNTQFAEFIQNPDRTTPRNKIKELEKARNEFRNRLWHELVLRGATKRGVDQAFAHCHRFSAEYKMFLHLAWLAIAIGVFYLWPTHWSLHIAGAAGAAFLLLCFAWSRNRRRWLQVLIFSKGLGIPPFPEPRSQASEK